MEEIISSRPHVMTWEWWELDGGNLSKSHLFPSDLVSSPTFDHGFEVLTWRGGGGAWDYLGKSRFHHFLYVYHSEMGGLWHCFNHITVNLIIDDFTTDD